MIFNLCLIFFISILYLFLCSKKGDKNKILFLRIVFLFLFIFCASREMTMGNDTPMYIKLYNNISISKFNFLSVNTYFENGYVIFNILLSYISDSSRFFLVVTSGIINFFCYKFIKKYSNDYFLSVIMYIEFLFFYTSMAMLRQFIAFCVIIIGFKYLNGKKPLSFLLFIIIASFFHSSAWLALAYYPIYYLKYSKRNVFILIIIFLISFYFLPSIVNLFYGFIGRVNYYSSRFDSTSFGNFIYFIMFFIMYLFILYECRKQKNIGDLQNNSLYLYSLLFATLINLLGIKLDVMSRAAFYFNILSIIAVPNVIQRFEKNKNSRFIVKLVMCFCLIVYANCIIAFRPDWNTAYNYKTCIFPKTGYICKR